MVWSYFITTTLEFLGIFTDLLNLSTAHSKLFGMAPPLLHCIYTACGILRTEHVRWSGCGELPPMQRRTGERRKSEKSSEKSFTNGEEETK